MDDPLFRCTDLTFFEQEELAEEDEIILPRHIEDKLWLPRCPLCGQEYCGCWEDDA